MPFFDIEIDREAPKNVATGDSQEQQEQQIQQQYSMMSSQFSESGSDSSLDGLADDEASILYSMESRNQPGLKQICEVPMGHSRIVKSKNENDENDDDDDNNKKEHNEDQIIVPSETQIENTKKNTSRAKMTLKSKSSRKDTTNRTKAIACILAVALSLTVMLIAFLINHMTSEAGGSAKDNLSKVDSESVKPEDSLVVVIPDVASPEVSDPPIAETTSVATMNAPTSTPVSTTEAPDAYTYFLNYMSSFTKREYLLDASRPQGRAFLQIVMDNNESFATLSHTNILQTYAVLTLYFSTSPKLWDSSFAWTDATSNICSWDGVVNCVEAPEGEKVVDGIALPMVGLSGALPQEICLLEHLERLDLRSNELSGLIPDCLTGSSSLKTLLLSDNAFTGYLPKGILLVPTLEELVLSNNSLLGGLETLVEGMFIKNLYRYGETWRLRRLNLENNLFSGAVPAFFGAFGGLRSLTLHGNHLTGDLDDDEELCSRTREGLTELTADCREVGCTCCTTCY